MKKTLIILSILIIFIGGFFVYENFGEKITGNEKCGDITKDETWQGEIHVICSVNVSEGNTLTILPGTIIKFKHDRNYKTFERAGLTVYGTIKAVGTPEKQIWFTSDAPDPINGDWMGITIFNSNQSVFDYVIVEFAEIAITQFDSSVSITNSIIRWINS